MTIRRSEAIEAGTAAASWSWGWLWLPLWTRIRVGEGGLVVVAATILACAVPGPWEVRLATWGAATLLLTLLYAFNDVWDAPIDRHNPRKDPQLVALWLAHRRSYLIAILLSSALAVIVLGLLRGRSAAVAALALVGVNTAYSLLAKRVGGWDVAVVALWGAFFVATVADDPWLALWVGAMTGVSHVFQTLQDRGADLRVGIETVAARPRQRRLVLALAVGAVAGVGWWAFGLGPWALLALFPWWWAERWPVARAWWATRWLYGGLLVAALWWVG